MKKLLLIINIAILLGAVYLIFVNLTNAQPIHYAHTELLQTFAPDNRPVRVVENSAYLFKMINIAGFIAATLFAGIIVGAGTVFTFLSDAKTKIKAYERELERTSVTGESNASKVDVLEAKIQTLEKAFNTVIDERTKLELQVKSLNTELEKLNKNN